VTRLLIVIALIAFVVFATRRVLSSGKRPPRGARPGRDASGKPKELVCGHCGVEFDADRSGWKCPECGK